MPFHYGYSRHNEIGVTNADSKLIIIPLLQCNLENATLCAFYKVTQSPLLITVRELWRHPIVVLPDHRGFRG